MEVDVHEPAALAEPPVAQDKPVLHGIYKGEDMFLCEVNSLLNVIECMQ